MSYEMVEIILHVDENTTHDEREELRGKVLARNGVREAAYRDKTPHLFVVGYDPNVVSSKSILETVKNSGVHAELLGPC